MKGGIMPLPKGTSWRFIKGRMPWSKGRNTQSTPHCQMQHVTNCSNAQSMQ